MACPFCGSEKVERMPDDYGLNRWRPQTIPEADVRSVLAAAGLDADAIEAKMSAYPEDFTTPAPPAAYRKYERCEDCTHTWPVEEV